MVQEIVGRFEVETNLPETAEFETYPVKNILSACRHIREFYKRPDFEIDNEAFRKTFLSAIVSGNVASGDVFKKNEISWEELLVREVNWACSNRERPEDAWDYISNQVFTAKVIKEFPELDVKESIEGGGVKMGSQDALRQAISRRPILDYALARPKLCKNRGARWRVDDRWEKLWPSSKKVLRELWYRTHFPEAKEAWPFAYAGIKSLVKVTDLSECQVKRALRQLQALGMISRIFRAYQGMGASKYRVFVTPGMSGAFLKKSYGKGRRKTPVKI